MHVHVHVHVVATTLSTRLHVYKLYTDALIAGGRGGNLLTALAIASSPAVGVGLLVTWVLGMTIIFSW